MYVTPRHARRGRRARRGLRHGLRGRRLLPARLGVRPPRHVRARRAAHPPRVQDARHGAGRARARLPGAASGSTWGDWFDKRETRAPDGGARIVYVTQDLGVGGGHRVVFEHLNGLLERGHHPELWTLVEGPPDWYDLEVPVRAFDDYDALRARARPAGRDQGRHLVGDRAAPCGRRACAAACPSTSSRTSRRATTPTATSTARCSPPTGPSSTYLTTSQWVHRALTSLRARRDASSSPGRRPRALARAARRARATRRVLAPRPRQPAQELPAHARRLRGAARARGRRCGCSAIEPEVAERHRRRASPTTASRPTPASTSCSTPAPVFLQTSAPRGLLPAGARGDGGRRARRLHGRRRQPRLLPRRRQLPDAGRRPASRPRGGRGRAGRRRPARATARRRPRDGPGATRCRASSTSSTRSTATSPSGAPPGGCPTRSCGRCGRGPRPAQPPAEDAQRREP